MNYSLNLVFSADDSIHFALPCLCGQVYAELVKKFPFLLLLVFNVSILTSGLFFIRNGLLIRISRQHDIKINCRSSALVVFFLVFVKLRHKLGHLLAHGVKLLLAHTHSFDNIVDRLDSELFSAFKAIALADRSAELVFSYIYDRNACFAAAALFY